MRPGALTGVLEQRLGAKAITAVDPSEPFVTAARERYPGVEVLQASAESLPFDDASFDLSLAQLVVHHMADPVAGIREMARVTEQGGVVAGCVWDHAGGRSPLTPLWVAVQSFDPDSTLGGSNFAGAREGELVQIFREAGLQKVHGDALAFEFEHTSFDEWWEPFSLGVGPAGRYVADLDPVNRARLMDLCRASWPTAGFNLSLRVWSVRGTVGSQV